MYGEHPLKKQILMKNHDLCYSKGLALDFVSMSHDWRFFEKCSILTSTGRNEITKCAISGLSMGDQLEELIMKIIISLLK